MPEKKPIAFISCSLREEDKHFINFILRIVQRFGFQPFGTVGMFASEPKPVWQSMKNNIEKSDCVILVATPRYIQQDINDRSKSGKGISEMLHVEVGMAVMANRPILVFVEEGTDTGNFIPSYVQYITLNPENREDVERKWPLIANYFRSALTMIQKKWSDENKSGMSRFFLTILAIIGGATLIDSIFSDNEE